MTGLANLQAVPGGDDSAVVVRPAMPRDHVKIRDFFAGLSHETVYKRFHGGSWESCMRDLCGETGADVVIAEAGNVIVGHVEVDAWPGTPAGEIAVVVDDGWQRRGVGGRLLDAAAARASQRGLVILIAYVSDDDHGLDRLISRINPHRRIAREGAGLLRAEIPLIPAGRRDSKAVSPAAANARTSRGTLPRSSYSPPAAAAGRG